MDHTIARTRAFSLIELIVGMTAGAVVFALAISTIERTMQLSRDSSERAEHQLAVDHFGQLLRSDAHAANEFRLITQDSEVQLTLKGNSSPEIAYRFVDSTITRVTTSADSSKVHRENFRLASNCKVRVDKVDAQRIELAIVRQTPEGELLDSRIAARLARLVSLQSIKKGE